MGIAHTDGDRTRTLGEEIANSVSHGVGLLMALIAVPLLIGEAARHGQAQTIVGVSVFGTTILLLFLSSTLYHAFPEGRAKHLFEILDNSAIFLMIAGTYTPFTLGLLGGVWGWSLFGVIWGMALAGILLTAIGGLRFPVLSACLCLAMGWLVVLLLRPLADRMPWAGLLLIIAGGVAYTLGIVFYAARRLPYHHLIWHLFVLTGTALHFLAIFRFAT